MRAASLSRQMRPWAAAALAAPRLAVTAAAPLARPASVRIPVACFASSAAPAHPDPAAGSPAPAGIVETFKAEWALMKDLGFWGKLKFLGKKYGCVSPSPPKCSSSPSPRATPRPSRGVQAVSLMPPIRNPHSMLSFGVYGVLYFGPWAGLYPVYLAVRRLRATARRSFRAHSRLSTVAVLALSPAPRRAVRQLRSGSARASGRRRHARLGPAHARPRSGAWRSAP